MKLEDAITEYLQHCENRQLDKKTIKAYRIDLTFFLKYAKEINMHTTTEITVDAIKDLIADWYKQERESTAYRRSASVRAFLKYLWEMDYTESNLYEKSKLKIKGVKYDAPDILSVKEIQHLFDGLYRQYSYAETDFQKLCGLRNIVLVEMLCFSGVRISEICSFRRENISFLSSAYIIR